MTTVYERVVPGAAVHAFVVGVGAYPFAKPGHAGPNTPDALTKVKDLPSAARGAARFADWLIAHADQLPARLASVELLISDPAFKPQAGGKYEWTTRPAFAAALAGGGVDPRSESAVEAATEANVEVAGQRWVSRLEAGDEPHVAIVFICGHGVALTSRSLVLLEDLAGLPKPRSRWEPFVDVQLLAATLGKVPTVRNAYVFVDACQEVLTAHWVATNDPTTSPYQGVRFFAPEDLAIVDSKVLLLLPGPMGSLAFDDGAGEGGRYTHVLIEALSGAAARDATGQGDWKVHSDRLARAMAELYDLRWSDHPLTPVPSPAPASDPALVTFSRTAPPKVPVRIRLDPAGAARHPGKQVELQSPEGAVIAPWLADGEVWLEWVEARRGLCLIRAVFPPDAPYMSADDQIDLSEMRVEPMTVHRVIP